MQIELNTIAASFGSLSAQVSALHQHLVSLHPEGSAATPAALPRNGALHGFAAAIGAAHAAVVGQQKLPEASVVSMVVQPGERNAYDQQWLQTVLWQEHGVRVVRHTLAEIGGGSEVAADGAVRCVLASSHRYREGIRKCRSLPISALTGACSLSFKERT